MKNKVFITKSAPQCDEIVREGVIIEQVGDFKLFIEDSVNFIRVRVKALPQYDIYRSFDDFVLFDTGTYNVTSCTIDARGKRTAYITQSGFHWRTRYHYSEALVVLCIGTYCRQRTLLKLKEMWKMIAKIVYFSWE